MNALGWWIFGGLTLVAGLFAFYMILAIGQEQKKINRFFTGGKNNGNK